MKFAGTTDEAAAAVRSDEPVGHEARTRDRIARSILRERPVHRHGARRPRSGSPRRPSAATSTRCSPTGSSRSVEPRTSAVRGRGRPARLFARHRRRPRLLRPGLRRPGRRARCSSSSSTAVVRPSRPSPASASPSSRRATARSSTQAPADGRTEALAEALSGDGYAATTRTAPGPGSSLGEQLCQHHCPVAHVAEKFPAAVRGRDRGLRAAARHPRPAARHDRPRRRRLHDRTFREPRPSPAPPTGGLAQ